MSQVRTSTSSPTADANSSESSTASAWDKAAETARRELINIAGNSGGRQPVEEDTSADAEDIANDTPPHPGDDKSVLIQGLHSTVKSLTPDDFEAASWRSEVPLESTKNWYSSDAQRQSDSDFVNRAGANPDAGASFGFQASKARFEAGLPLLARHDTMSLMTTEKGADGKTMTVGELAWKNAMADWTKRIEEGEIGPDDDRAKLIRVVQAGLVLEHGMDMYTLDIGTGVNVQKALGLDFNGIIDGTKLEKAVADLMGSEAVAKDMAAARSDALGKAPDLSKATAELKEFAFSADYAKYIQTLSQVAGPGFGRDTMQDLRQLGGDLSKREIAKHDIQIVYSSLLDVDPEAAAEFAQNMQLNAMTMELDNLVGNPDMINEANLTQAGMDMGKMMLTLIKKGVLDLGRRGAEAEKFFQEVLGNKKTATEFSKAMQELGALFSQNGTVSASDLERVMGNGKYTSLEGSTVRAIFDDLTKQGVIGSLGGAVSLTSAIYQLAGKGGTLADTTEERLAIAKDFVGFLGAGKNFADLANNIVGDYNRDVMAYNEYLEAHIDPLNMSDGLKKKPATPLFGLDKTLDDLVKGPSETIGGTGQPASDRLKDAMEEEINRVTANLDYNERLYDAFDEMTPEDKAQAIKGLEDGYQMRPDLLDADGKPVSNWHKGASAALLVMSAGADTFAGAADIAIGALTIQKGTASGDNVTTAKGALQVAAGGFGVAGGFASSLGLTRGLAMAKAATGPSFFISAVLSIATLIPDIINDIKRTNEIKGYRDSMRDLFTQFEKDGILAEDGLDKYRFLDAYMTNYGQRDAPGNQSILDYRRDEVAHFLEYWSSDRSSFQRERGEFTSGFGLDDDNHADYGGDGNNLNTKMDRMG